MALPRHECGDHQNTNVHAFRKADVAILKAYIQYMIADIEGSSNMLALLEATSIIRVSKLIGTGQGSSKGLQMAEINHPIDYRLYWGSSVHVVGVG